MKENELIGYDFGDRKAEVAFLAGKDGVTVRVAFDPEKENSVETQRSSWQAIPNNFKRHVEAN